MINPREPNTIDESPREPNTEFNEEMESADDSEEREPNTGAVREPNTEI